MAKIMLECREVFGYNKLNVLMGSIGCAMKSLKNLIWLTQLGLSVAVPPICFILLAVWLRGTHGWGSWVIWVGILLGVYSALEGFRASMKAMALLNKDKENDDPPVSFNEHQ